MELTNGSNRYAVAIIIKDGSIIGHIPRQMSRVCLLFLRRGTCLITGTRVDLPQGGMVTHILVKIKTHAKNSMFVYIHVFNFLEDLDCICDWANK